MRRALFGTILALAIYNNSDLGPSREVIASFDRRWLSHELRRRLPDLLDSAGPEAYRGFAELLRQLNSRLLLQVVERAAQQTDPEVREVASDFGNEATRHFQRRLDPGLDEVLKLAPATSETSWRALQSQLNAQELRVLQLLREGQNFDAIAVSLRLPRARVEGIAQRILSALLAMVSQA